jgi:tetratricopeptide (TPR) repeat protein
MCKGGRVSEMTDQLGDRLRALYDNASFGGDPTALDQGASEIKAAEAQLALARGRFLHARFFVDHEDRPEQLDQLTKATELFHELGDMRGEAEATFWAAIYHQVIHHDETTAVPLLERAQTLAGAANDLLVMSYVVRHLGFVDVNAEQFDPAHEKFEESVRLRRQIGFLPGVAAGLVALAELAATMADRPTAQRYLEEASTICSETDSKGAMRWISQVREEHGLT